MNSKLKASTLIETIIAMVIILIVFGIIMNFYSGQIKSFNNSSKIKAYYILNKVSSNDLNKKSFSDEEFRIESFLIRRTIISYNNKESLYLLNYECLDTNQNILLQRKKVVLIKNLNAQF